MQNIIIYMDYIIVGKFNQICGNLLNFYWKK